MKNATEDDKFHTTPTTGDLPCDRPDSGVLPPAQAILNYSEYRVAYLAETLHDIATAG